MKSLGGGRDLIVMSGVWRWPWEDTEGTWGRVSGGNTMCHRDRDGSSMAACPGIPRISSNHQTLEEVRKDLPPPPAPRASRGNTALLTPDF